MACPRLPDWPVGSVSVTRETELVSKVEWLYIWYVGTAVASIEAALPCCNNYNTTSANGIAIASVYLAIYGSPAVFDVVVGRFDGLLHS